MSKSRITEVNTKNGFFIELFVDGIRAGRAEQRSPTSAEVIIGKKQITITAATSGLLRKAVQDALNQRGDELE